MLTLTSEQQSLRLPHEAELQQDCSWALLWHTAAEHKGVLQASWPDWVDRSLQLPAYWAEWEARSAGDLKAARAVWEAAVKGALGK